MRYGGNNSVIDGKCPRCGESPDKHKPFPYIESSRESDQLVGRLGQKLSKVSLRSIELDFPAIRGAVMLGAAVATLGSKTVKYVTISGFANALIGKIDSLGAGVEVIDLANCSRLPNYVVFNGKRVPGVPAVAANDAEETVNAPPATGLRVYRLETNLAGQDIPLVVSNQASGRDYPVGSCAAQKLVTRVLSDACAAHTKITAFAMSEMFWRDFQSERGGGIWSTLETVESCDTCKQVIPQLLCSGTPSSDFKAKVRKQEIG